MSVRMDPIAMEARPAGGATAFLRWALVALLVSAAVLAVTRERFAPSATAAAQAGDSRDALLLPTH